MTISRPRAGRNCQFEREPTPSLKTLKYGETVDALKPGAAPRAGAKTESSSGRFAAFCGVFRPRFRAARLRTRPRAKPRPKRRRTALQGYFEVARYTPDTARSKPCTQAHDAPRGLVKRRPNAHNRRPPSTRNPPRNAKRPPPRRVPPSESLKVGKVGKSKVGKSIAKVGNRPKSRESRLFSQSRKS